MPLTVQLPDSTLWHRQSGKQSLFNSMADRHPAQDAGLHRPCPRWGFRIDSEPVWVRSPCPCYTFKTGSASSILQNRTCDAGWTGALNQNRFCSARACAQMVNKQQSRWSRKNRAVITFVPPHSIDSEFDSGSILVWPHLTLLGSFSTATKVDAKAILAISILSNRFRT